MKKLVPSLGSNCLTLNLKKLICEGSIQIVFYSRKVGKTSSVFLEVTIPLITLKLTLEGGMLHITYICILLTHLTIYVYIYTNTQRYILYKYIYIYIFKFKYLYMCMCFCVSVCVFICVFVSINRTHTELSLFGSVQKVCLIKILIHYLLFTLGTLSQLTIQPTMKRSSTVLVCRNLENLIFLGRLLLSSLTSLSQLNFHFLYIYSPSFTFNFRFLLLPSLFNH